MTQMPNDQRLARLEAQMENVLTGVSSINDKLDMWNQNYVPRTEIDSRFKSLLEDIKELREAHEQEKADRRSFKSTYPVWVSAGAAVGMAILTLITLTH